MDDLKSGCGTTMNSLMILFKALAEMGYLMNVLFLTPRFAIMDNKVVIQSI